MTFSGFLGQMTFFKIILRAALFLLVIYQLFILVIIFKMNRVFFTEFPSSAVLKYDKIMLVGDAFTVITPQILRLLSL